MNTLRLISAVCALLIFSSCATGKFQPGKPITPGGPWGHLIQDGETISEGETFEFLKSNALTAEKAKRAETRMYVSIAPAVVGGYLIGYNLVDRDRQSDTGLWIGVGLAAASGMIAARARVLFVEAVDEYNQSLVSSTKKTSSLSLHPVFAQQPGTFVPAPGAGLSLSF
jgi:hypothetical protein